MERKNCYTTLVFFYITRRVENLEKTATNVTTEADFDTNIPQNYNAYHPKLSKRDMQAQSDGDRMHIIN